jgi:hypothetical protein
MNRPRGSRENLVSALINAATERHASTGRRDSTIREKATTAMGRLIWCIYPSGMSGVSPFVTRAIIAIAVVTNQWILTVETVCGMIDARYIAWR